VTWRSFLLNVVHYLDKAFVNTSRNTGYLTLSKSVIKGSQKAILPNEINLIKIQLTNIAYKNKPPDDLIYNLK